MKKCTKCGLTLPTSSFNRRLTDAQAQARGYSGNRKITIESSMCKACQPKPKPPRKYNKQDIAIKLRRGRLSILVADKLTSEIDERSKHKQRNAVIERWHRTWRTQLTEILKPMKAEIRAVRSQCKYYASKAHADRFDFFVDYLSVLENNLARIQLAFATDPSATALIMKSIRPTPRWQGMVEQLDIENINLGWHDLGAQPYKFPRLLERV